MAVANTIVNYLKRRAAIYDVVAHPRAVTSQEVAAAAHVPGDRLAKSVILKDEQGYVMAVLPSTHRLQLGALHRQLDRELGLATEPEIADIFPDCEVGAIPALGPAYGIETIVDDSLAEQADVYFEAGDHEELIHLSGVQFQSLMHGVGHGRISRHS